MRSDLSSLANNLSEIKDHGKCLDKKTIKDLIRNFRNTYNFCEGDINKFVMLFRKGVILMNIWIVGKDLTKPLYHLKRIFIAN